MPHRSAAALVSFPAAEAGRASSVVPDERTAARLAPLPGVLRALEWLERNAEWITHQHIRINEIPAPTFAEKRRAGLLRRLLAAAGCTTRLDAAGNVIATQAGEAPAAGSREAQDAVVISAHLDTVFSAAADVRVKREGARLVAPGISDNACGLAAVVAVAHALHAARLRTRAALLFVANVAEEGEGNLLGMRRLMSDLTAAASPRLRAVIVIDGAVTDHITTQALASRRIECAVTGRGGHSWADFGLPNPVHAVSRGVARFVRTRVPESPRTTFNVGVIEGGTTVNSIPQRAAVKVDLRSAAEAEIDRMEESFRESMQQGVGEERSAARARGVSTTKLALSAEFRLLGARPGGELPADSPLLAAIRGADRFLGIRPHIERSSTDANIPLSMGIPAIAVGGGGNGGGAHTLEEWYEPAGRAVGLKRILLTALAVAGVSE